MTTVVIRRNRKGEITAYHHVGQWCRWLNPAPECWPTYTWGRDNFRGLHYRIFYAFEFEIGGRAAIRLGA